MRKMRSKIDPSLNAKVAIETIKGEKTIAQFASEYGVHPNQVGQWKKHLLEDLPGLFRTNAKSRRKTAKS